MNWSSFLGQGMQSYADTRQKQQQLNQPGEWKPQSMAEAIKLKQAGKSPQGYNRAYLLDPEGGYKSIKFPEAGRVIPPRSEAEPSMSPMWAEWMSGTPLPIKGGVIEPPKTREEAIGKMTMSGVNMNDPLIAQALQGLPNERTESRASQLGGAVGRGFNTIRGQAPQQAPQMPQRGRQQAPMNKVAVIDPDGKAGFIPKEQLLQALKEGYKIR